MTLPVLGLLTSFAALLFTVLAWRKTRGRIFLYFCLLNLLAIIYWVVRVLA